MLFGWMLAEPDWAHNQYSDCAKPVGQCVQVLTAV
ncbi:hypothetical protein EVA_03529 [gut metagenome]|uniref:Uncharacterized protein n=1 Tax=gut metagenome TaxID=749906 RepID=J9GLM5_9ZZZZ